MTFNKIDETITFDSLEECVEIKNKLIAFIKHNKREINDKGNDPDALKQPAGEVVEENGDGVPNCQQNQRNIGKNHQEWVDGSDR